MHTVSPMLTNIPAKTNQREKNEPQTKTKKNKQQQQTKTTHIQKKKKKISTKYFSLIVDTDKDQAAY